MSRLIHLVIFLALFALVLVLSHLYIFWRVSFYLHLDAHKRAILATLLGVLAVATLVSLPLSRILPYASARFLLWIIFPWMGCFLLLLVGLIAADSVWLASMFFSSATAYNPDRRLVFNYALGTVALGSTGGASLYALWNGLRPVKVKSLAVTVPRWPIDADGLRIAQISDLHIGPLIDGAWLRNVVNQVNGLRPDIIVITGDLVDGAVADLAPHTAALADLRAAHGVYFITGNHEYYSGVDEWCAHLAGLGIHVLRNRYVSLPAFDLAGVDDSSGRTQDGTGDAIAQTLQGRDAGRPVILLAHQPKDIHQAAAHGVDLQLSGHTHGGQIWPFNLLVYLQQPFTQGLHRYKDSATQIYVSPGTGFWGPPMRLGTHAEITHITVKAAKV